MLNPGLAYGKQFAVDEIRRVADGTILDAGQKLVVQKATQIFLGQPAVFPQRLVDAVSRLCRQRSSIEAAYLAQVLIQGEPSPHPVTLTSRRAHVGDLESGRTAASSRLP